MISAILLAAGESRRMGEFKQLLPFAGKTFVECCVDNLLASGVADVIVVTGHREAEVRHALGGRAVSFAHNPDYQGGMSTSIQKGVEAVSNTAGAVLLSLVDQPQVTPAAIRAIIAAFIDKHPLIAVPNYGGKHGHPILLDLMLRDEILAMDPAVGLRQVVHAYRDETLYVDMPTEDVLLDCDFPEDYLRLKGLDGGAK